MSSGKKYHVNKGSTEEDSSDPWRDRGHWGSYKEFLLVAFAVPLGTGTMMRFPYFCYRNGGVTFVLMYVLMMFLLGVPIFYLESAIAQFSSSTIWKIYDMCPPFRGAGFCTLLAMIFYVGFMGVYSAQGLVLLYHTFGPDTLPWSIDAIQSESTNFTSNVTLDYGLNEFDDFLSTSANVVTSSSSPNASFIVSALIISVLALLLTIKGVRVIGKMIWVTLFVPLVLFIILLIKGFTLPGCLSGISFLLSPRIYPMSDSFFWERLTAEVTYSLGIGTGLLIFSSSHNRYRQNPLAGAIIVPIATTTLNILFTLLVGSYAGFLALKLEVSFEDVYMLGSNHLYSFMMSTATVLPSANAWLALYFLMMVFFTFNTYAVGTEAIVMTVCDKFTSLHSRKFILSVVVSIFMFLVTCSVSLILSMRHASLSIVIGSDFICAIAFMLQLIVFIFIYGNGRVLRDVSVMVTRKQQYFWVFVWIIISFPATLFLFYSQINATLHISYSIVPLVFGPLVIIIGWIKYVSKFTYESDAHLPLSSFGPLNPHYKQEWKEYCQQMPEEWNGVVGYPSAKLPSEFVNLEMNARTF